MRKSKAEASKTRRHIVSTAAAEFRKGGIDGTGLADVMATAGLTHGGFYGHFDAKNQLVAEVCTEALGNTASTMRAVVSSKPNTLKAAADKYLSASHRDDHAHGCPLVALGSEIARCDDKVRAAATAGILQMAQALADGLTDKRQSRAKQRALVALSAMVGALTLARIVDDPNLSNLILQETRRHVATV
jgi:TetR/AcrR family transcriptional repressor of nem operon